MNYLLAVLSGFLATPAIAAGPALVGERHAPRQERFLGEVQVAQAYDFDVYVDQWGREIIVDPRTGQVVEIRGPARGAVPVEPWSPPPSGRYREYNLTDPRDLERFQRDRDAAIRGADPYEEPDYVQPRSDPYDRDYGGYRQLPPEDEGGFRRFPPEDRGYGEEGPLPPSGRTVRRAPLAPPLQSDDDEYASVPEPGPETNGAGLSGQEPGRQSLPEEPAIVVPGSRHASEDVAAYQVLLDRAGASPGVIDGHTGDNVNNAIDAYHAITGERLKTYDKEWIAEELERTGGPAFVEYTITAEDAAGPFIASVPSDYGDKAQLERLSYTRVSEMLAERFHMDEKYLLQLNPEANFHRPGTIIRVANVGKPATYDVARLVADKRREQLRVYDKAGRLVAAYPATIGSTDTPSPTGTHEVARVAFNPEYTYNPKKNFKQGNNDKVLTIPPGPNGPVGSIWIALSKPTYGIHGTPEPSKIGKTSSHGCIRLTNWDAEELAKRVKTGVPVEFVD